MAYFSIYWLRHYDEIPKEDQERTFSGTGKDIDWIKRKGIYPAGLQCIGDKGRPPNVFGGVKEMPPGQSCTHIYVSKNGTVYYFEDLKDWEYNAESNNGSNDYRGSEDDGGYGGSKDVSDYLLGGSANNNNYTYTPPPPATASLPVIDKKYLTGTVDVTGSNPDPAIFNYPKHKFKDVTELYNDPDWFDKNIKNDWDKKDKDSGKDDGGASGGASGGPSGGRHGGTGGTSKGPSGKECKCDHDDEDEEEDDEKHRPVTTTKEKTNDKQTVDDCQSWRTTQPAPKWRPSETPARRPLADTEKDLAIQAVKEELKGKYRSGFGDEYDFGERIEYYKSLGYEIILNVDMGKEYEEVVEGNGWNGGHDYKITKEDPYYIRNYQEVIARGDDNTKRWMIINAEGVRNLDGTVSMSYWHSESIPYDYEKDDWDRCPSEKRKKEEGTGGTGKTSVGDKKHHCKCDDKGGTDSPSGHGGTHKHSGVSGGPSGKKKECKPAADVKDKDVTDKCKITSDKDVTNKSNVADAGRVTDKGNVAKPDKTRNDSNPDDEENEKPTYYYDPPNPLDKKRYLVQPEPEFTPSPGPDCEKLKYKPNYNTTKLALDFVEDKDLFDKFYKKLKNAKLCNDNKTLSDKSVYLLIGLISIEGTWGKPGQSFNYYGLKENGKKLTFTEFDLGFNKFISELQKKWPNFVELLCSGDEFNSDQINKSLNSGPYIKLGLPPYCYDNDDLEKIKEPLKLERLQDDGSTKMEGMRDYGHALIDQIRTVFNIRMGVNEKKIEELQKKIESLKKQLKAKEKSKYGPWTIKSMKLIDDEIQNLKKQIEDTEKEIADLECNNKKISEEVNICDTKNKKSPNKTNQEPKRDVIYGKSILKVY